MGRDGSIVFVAIAVWTMALIWGDATADVTVKSIREKKLRSLTSHDDAHATTNGGQERPDVVDFADPVVHDLDISNFDAMVGNGSTWLVKFYAPWCRRSMALKPVIDSVSSFARSNGLSDVHVGRVNADQEVALSYRFYVDTTNMPYMYIITPYGKTHFFNESSKKEDILDFLMGGHEDRWSMHVFSNPMTIWWKLAFAPLSWLTVAYGHMQAIFIAYISMLVVFCIFFLLSVHFISEVAVFYMIRRIQRDAKKRR